MILTKPWSQYVSVPNWALLLLSGVLCGLGFISGYAAILVLVGLLLLVTLLNRATRVGQSIMWGWGIWFVQSLFVDAWLWHAYPIDWIPFESVTIQLAVIGLHWITIALWLSSTGLVIGFAYWYIKHTTWSVWLRAVVLASVFVLAEQFGALVFSIATIGPGTLPNIYFGLGFLGNVVSHIPFLIPFAFFGGVYILTWLVAAYIVIVHDWLQQRALIKVFLLTLTVALVSFMTQVLVLQNEHTTEEVVAVVTTSFSALLLQNEAGRQEKQDALEAAVAAAYKYLPEYVLLPEDSRYLQNAYPGQTPERAFAYHRFAFGDPSTILIDSGRIDRRDQTAILRATIFNGHTKTVSYQEKRYLVPQGEFISYFYAGVFRLLGYGAIVDIAKQEQSYRPGVALANDIVPVVPVLFCFESVNPQGVQSIMRITDVPFIAHPISHAWFHQPHILWHQLDAALRIQAVWNQVPIISAANMAQSLVYLPNGRVTAGTVVASGDLWEVRIVNLADL